MRKSGGKVSVVTPTLSITAPSPSSSATTTPFSSPPPSPTLSSPNLTSSSSSSSSSASDESLHFFRQFVSRRSVKGKTWTLTELSEVRASPDVSPSGSARKAKRRSTSLVRLLSGSRASESSSPSASSSSSSGSPATTFKAQATAAKQFAPPLWLPLVDYLCRVIELHGRDKLGIFRLSGNARTVAEVVMACGDLISRKASEEEMQKLFEPHMEEVHVMASVLKAYFREQKEPLFPVALYDAFLNAAEITDVNERLAQLKALVSQLPEGKRNILHRLVQALVAIAENSEENKMDPSNLAIVFGPSLLKAESDGLDIIFKIRAQCLVIENCIQHHATIFLGQEVQQKDIESDWKSPRSGGASDDEDEDEEDLDKLAQEMEEAEKESRDFDTIIEELTQEAEEPTKQDHAFKKETFNPFSPTMCRHCRKFIFGIRKAYLCKNCNFPAHAKCRKSVGKTCHGCDKDLRKAAKLLNKKKPEPIAVGDQVPMFTLKDGKGKSYSIEDSLHMNKRIVLFFYPKDFTPGCTRENKAFRDQYSLFHYADCEIIGISGDSSACHARFAAKHKIPFRLLSDPKNEVREQFGVPDSMGGLAPGRVTYVIEPSGMVAHMYNSLFNPQEHLVHSLHAISQMLLHDMTSSAPTVSAAS